MGNNIGNVLVLVNLCVRLKRFLNDGFFDNLRLQKILDDCFLNNLIDIWLSIFVEYFVIIYTNDI